MFFSSNGLVFVSKNPGESKNQYYLKSENILKKITLEETKKFYISSTQVENIYNLATKEASSQNLDCKYF
jgi:hypothetical protein